MHGTFPELEDQLCGWEPNSGQRSPNRLDALVWALTELIFEGSDDVGEGWYKFAAEAMGRPWPTSPGGEE